MSSDSGGWRPLSEPRPPGPLTEKGAFTLSPFARLARVHAASAGGDAMIAVALAGSLFFSIDPSDARWRVGLYLALTVAPFAIVGPLIGPALDRVKGGRRAMVTAISALRVLLAALMIPNTDSLLLFPLAFGLLVLGKGYAVAKAAIVPTTVASDDELVDRNSRLALLSGVSGFAGAVPAALASLLVGPGGAVALATVTFGVALVLSFRLPSIAIAPEPEDPLERQELHSRSIVLAASGMGILRGLVGFLTFLLAFELRGGTDDLDLSGTGSAVGAKVRESLGFSLDGGGGVPAWQFAIVVAFGVMGALVGAVIAPRLRRSTPEENILVGALAVTGLVCLFGAWSGDLMATALVSLAVSMGAAGGKLAFDSIVQRDAPDANYGRTFARFETRFQLIWVMGALIPVLVKLPARLGYLGMAIVAGFAVASYVFGRAGRSFPRPSVGGRGPKPQEKEPPAAAPVDPETELTDDDLRPAYPESPLDDQATRPWTTGPQPPS